VIGGGSALRSRLAGAYAACAVLASGIWLHHRVDQGDEAVPRTAVLVAPDVAGWQRVGDWQDARRPHYVGTTAQSASWYADGAARVGTYVAHYGTQRPEHEVVFSANRPQGEFGTVVARRRMALATDSSASLPFQELEVTDSAAERRLVWVGLRVAGKPAGSALAAKALQIAGAIRGRRDAQAVVLTAACRDDCSSARSALSRYAAAAANPLHERVEAYRSRR
jgi:EpsI family protein